MSLPRQGSTNINLAQDVQKGVACSSSTASVVQERARLVKVRFDSSLVACFARSIQFRACVRHSLGSPGMLASVGAPYNPRAQIDSKHIDHRQD